MRIASIDIGTNAIKSKIFETTPTQIIFHEGIRSPMRLGEEVFNKGYITKKKLDELIKILKKYQNTFSTKDIQLYEIVATSALRDSANSEEARRYIENNIDHPIRIISGLEEANLIKFHPKAKEKNKRMYVDVGGGSTDIFIYQNNKNIIKSFQLGAVRCMQEKDDKEEWHRLRNWLKKQNEIDTLVGLGGNIRSFLNIHKSKRMNNKKFLDETKKLSTKSTNEKIQKFGLAFDRADVIDHAMKIFIEIVQTLNISEIKSTKWGVSDSIAVKLFHEIYSNKIDITNN